MLPAVEKRSRRAGTALQIDFIFFRRFGLQLRFNIVEKDDAYGDRGNRGHGEDGGNRADGQLMARWQEGDAAAFGVLVRRWEGAIARFLARMLGRAAPIDDLCQEVFVRVCDAGARY